MINQPYKVNIEKTAFGDLKFSVSVTGGKLLLFTSGNSNVENRLSTLDVFYIIENYQKHLESEKKRIEEEFENKIVSGIMSYFNNIRRI